MLNLPETYARMGKLSNNLEKHGEEDVTAFDIPFDGITLTSEQLCAFLEDPYADRWLFNTKANVRESNLARFKPLELDEIFDEATVVLTIFDTSYTFSDCRVKDIVLLGQRGGDVLLSLNVRLRPENDDQIVTLIAQQNHEVKIDVQDAKIVLKGGRKQIEMPLSQAKADDEGGDAEMVADWPGDGETLTHPEQLFKKAPKKNGKARARKGAH